MVTIDTKLSKLKKLVKGKLTKQILEKTLTDMGMELDAINKDEVKITVTAERTDLVTPEGLARAINCYLGYSKYKEIKVKKSNKILNVSPSVKKYCPHARGFIVKGIKLTDYDIKELMWVQEKLHDTYGRKRKKFSMGVYELDKIKFPIKYSAKKPEQIKFIPLGMKKELNGKQILRQHPTGRKYAHIISNHDRYQCHTDANNQILSMPPIINSNHLGQITSKTKNLFVETTGQDEKTLDNLMRIMATMFSDQGGEIYSINIKYPNKTIQCPLFKSEKRTISTKFINSLIGLNLKPSELKKLLPKMMYQVTAVKGDKINITIPATRIDIWHNVDIADDVARAYGFNNIKPTLPNISTISNTLPITYLQEDISNYLANLGLTEVLSFGLTNNEDQFEKMQIKPTQHIKLGNDTAEKSINMVRNWMLPETIKCFTGNRNRSYPQNIFEIGEVVIPDNKKQPKARNEHKLTIALCDKNITFTNIKQMLDSLFNYLDLPYTLKKIKHNSFIEGRVGEIIVKNKKIGIIGEIHPQVLTNFNLEYPIAALELNLNKTLKL